MAVKIVPISEVRQNFKRILSLLESTGDPYFITQYSRPKAVLVRYEDYNNLVEQAEQSAAIERREGVSGGEPVLSGTRITVVAVVQRIQAGQTVQDVLAAYPHINEAQVYSALAYYHSHRDELDPLIEASEVGQVLADQTLAIRQVADGIAEAYDTEGKS